jgi:hypothetical protein
MTITTRTRRAITAAAVTAALIGGAAIGHTTTTRRHTDAATTPVTCTTPVLDTDALDTWPTAALDTMIAICDHRFDYPDRCEEDEWCAIAEVNDTGNYTGRHAPGTR